MDACGVGSIGQRLTIISDLVLIDDSTLPLPGNVGYPDTPNPDTLLSECLYKILP